jgi:uncharacterized repeat protein (TIGR03803 family)
MYLTDHAARLRVPAMLVAALVLAALSGEVKAASFDTLYSFPADGTRGSNPLGSMVQDGKGALYGVTYVGGSACDCGVIYQLKPTASGPWKQKILHKFSVEQGSYPSDGIIVGPDGTLYGTTVTGGSLNGGTVFALVPPAPGQSDWTFATLHEFDGASTNDRNPESRLLLGADGALYGMDSVAVAGTIFRIKRSKTGWAYRALYHFTQDATLKNGLAQDDQGRLYGVSQSGGANNRGFLFRLSPPPAAGGDWVYKALHHFSDDAADAANPQGTPVLRDGALYGQAYSNVAGEGSVVFRLTLPSTFEIIYRMDLDTQGNGRGTGLAIDRKGAIYGVNPNSGRGDAGTLFKLLPPASGNMWSFRMLHAFGNAPDGNDPYCSPLLGEDGNVYVNTQSGGADSEGGVFVDRP